MKNKHHIVVESKRLKYEFDIKRNITVIQGDSASGKTTLLDLLGTHSRFGKESGISVQSDVPCVVFGGDAGLWKTILEAYQDSIVFIDEDYPFIYSKDFAELVQASSNYFVLITRQPLYNLPYSVREIYGIRTTGKYHYPEQVYHEFYRIYNDLNEALDKEVVAPTSKHSVGRGMNASKEGKGIFNTSLPIPCSKVVKSKSLMNFCPQHTNVKIFMPKA